MNEKNTSKYYSPTELDGYLNRMKMLKGFSTEELLLYLACRGGIGVGPVKRQWSKPPVDIIVGIGADNTANITMAEDDWEALNDMVSPGGYSIDIIGKREFVYELVREGLIGANTSNIIEEYLDKGKL